MVKRTPQVGSQKADAAVILFGLGLFLVLLGGFWSSLHLAAAMDGLAAPAANPFGLAASLVKGDQQWTSTATTIAVVEVVMLVVLFFGGLLVWARAGRKKMRSDGAAKYMGEGADLRHLREGGARKKAARLAPTAVGFATTDATKNQKKNRRVSPGVPFGETVRGGSMLYASWEDMLILIAGPRTQKSTAFAIPSVLAALGACLSTSNKRDVVDATRGLRAKVGRVWVFDPQQVANEPAAWWWNPLTYVAPMDPTTDLPRVDPVTGWVEADEAKAEKLAGQFAASSRSPGARTDAYFDGEAENLIGLLLLAAAIGNEPITRIYSWLTTPSDETATDLLAANGFALQQESLYSLAHLPDKQREGVYGTARSLMGFLRNRRLVQWVTPAATRRPQFHPTAFAASTDTIYPLSREGEGSAGPLVAALTVAIVDALEERATASPGGRLPVPFVGVLDEAANICRFRNLDSYYSHFGSRGIILFTILQNWAQGEEVWGRGGMEKLWSAANVKIYGGGVDDDRFLRRISDLIGTYERVSHSESVGRGQRSRSRSIEEKTILTISELRELPPGRAIAFPSGTPSVLIHPVAWFDGVNADEIRASIAQHAPSTLITAAPAAPAVPPAVSAWSSRPLE